LATDAKLKHRARELLVRLAKKYGVVLHQSYARVGKQALMADQRYAHAKQFKRANRALCRVRAYFDRVLRDIVRKTKNMPPCAGPSPGRCRWPSGRANSARTSAAGRSIRCTLSGSNALARASPL
jgi:hypothetical protein